MQALKSSLAADIPAASVGELKGFGQFLLGAAVNRTEQIKNRAVSIIGWALVSLAFLLRGHGQAPSFLIAFAGVLALAAIGVGVSVAWRDKRRWLNLPVWFWKTPGSDDYSNLQQPEMLAKSHVVRMAEIYQDVLAYNAAKSNRLLYAELAIAGCGVLILAAILGF